MDGQMAQLHMEKHGAGMMILVRERRDFRNML